MGKSNSQTNNWEGSLSKGEASGISSFKLTGFAQLTISIVCLSATQTAGLSCRLVAGSLVMYWKLCKQSTLSILILFLFFAPRRFSGHYSLSVRLCCFPTECDIEGKMWQNCLQLAARFVCSAYDCLNLSLLTASPAYSRSLVIWQCGRRNAKRVFFKFFALFDKVEKDTLYILSLFLKMQPTKP